jgi:N-acylneuraminate cytidylyltransferase
MKIYAFIFARGGSVGCKNKNIRLLGNKPLIAHSIELAKSIENITKVIVSTDSTEISNIATNFGADLIINRPKHLATSESKELDSWVHAINFLKDIGDTFDLFISIPCIAPLRTKDDINNCIQTFIHNKSDLLVTTTKEEKIAWACTIDENNFIKPYNNNKWENRRQDFNKDVRLITPVCYISTSNHILNIKHILDGDVSTYLIPYERSIDIDNEIDFQIVETLFNNNQLIS